MSEPLYPEITVDLTDNGADIGVILDRVSTALRQARISPDEVQRFIDEATADFANILTTAEAWVNIT